MKRTCLAVLLLIASAAAAQPAPDGELQLVVALFRHGVRAPLDAFASTAEIHSKQAWPVECDWFEDKQCKKWGDLTQRGAALARQLGKWYGQQYCGAACKNGYKVCLWADVDQRTKDTAEALKGGLTDAGVPEKDIFYSYSSGKVDPLFHAFKAGCVKFTDAQLKPLVSEIEADEWDWWNSKYRAGSSQLERVLKCFSKDDCKQPVFEIPTKVMGCDKYVAPFPGNDGCESPISWKGKFSFASSATEAFMLEYADGMPERSVGWGRVFPPATGQSSMTDMLALHEIYFRHTERPTVVAKAEAANLVKQIQTAIRRAGPYGKSQFIGLVGHDTNLANINGALGLHWSFGNVPGITKRMPDDDAMPAGALVFELRQRGNDKFVQVWYVAQTLEELRGCVPHRPDTNCSVARIPAYGGPCKPGAKVCEMTLPAFEKILNDALDKQPVCNTDEVKCE